MSSYSGEDSVDVFLSLHIYKNPNSVLCAFENKDKENYIEVWLGKDSIDKFYFYDLKKDLKEECNEQPKIFNFLNDFYEKNGSVYEDCTLEIYYEVSGYYDPGNTSGPPEYCYPPEGDEERSVSEAGIRIEDFYLKIPKNYIGEIEDVYNEEIQKNDFTPSDNSPDYDEYDYDERYKY